MRLSVDLTVADVRKSAEFYRKLGIEGPDIWEQDGQAHHVEIQEGLMLNSRSLTRSYDPSVGEDSTTILIFECDSRQQVDAKFAELVGAGHRAHLEPFDAFWGSRYAVVDDPDGNHVGLMGPRDSAHGEVELT
jgi:uncharacterized glyoxalase superfamily protein PhnB